MEKLILISLSLFLNSLAYCEKCKDSTFHGHLIIVQESDKNSSRTVNGCISSKDIACVNLKSIQILGQKVPVIKRGAVSDVSDWFALSIVNNSIEKIDSEAFININAHSINLDHNGIKSIEMNAFTDLLSLEVINLEHNMLTVLPEKTFENLPKISMVSLSFNNLESFEQNWFYQTPKLEYLFLDNNKLRSIQKEAFSNLTKMKYITCENNFIEYIHRDAFYGLHNLQELYLSKNRISKFDIDFSNFGSLVFLAVDGNFLTYISLDELRNVQTSLKSMYIYGNPWQCSCLQDFLNWGNQHNVKLYWKCKNESLTCLVPEESPEKCKDRPANEFNSDIVHNFNRDCKKL